MEFLFLKKVLVRLTASTSQQNNTTDCCQRSIMQTAVFYTLSERGTSLTLAVFNRIKSVKSQSVMSQTLNKQPPGRSKIY